MTAKSHSFLIRLLGLLKGSDCFTSEYSWLDKFRVWEQSFENVEVHCPGGNGLNNVKVSMTVCLEYEFLLDIILFISFMFVKQEGFSLLCVLGFI